MKEFLEFLTRAFNINHLKEIWRNPSVNATDSILFLSIIVVGILAVLTWFGLILTRSRSAQRPTSLVGLAFMLAVISFLLITVSELGFRELGRSNFCVGCHKDELAIEPPDWSHKEMACRQCHQAIGLFRQQAIMTAKLVTINFKGKPSKGGRMVLDQNACLLQCHGDVASRVLSDSGLRIKHKEILTAGYDCLDCHGEVAHGRPDPQEPKSIMAVCIDCHDGRKASSRCDICHIDKPDMRPKLPDRRYKKAHIGELLSCPDCHASDDGCRRCHEVLPPS